jgi:CRP-like cAMP-binding protein
MNLITGNPRTATLRVDGETELLAIPKEAFMRILALRPEMPERLAGLVAQRAAQNAAAYAQSKATGVPPAGEALHQRSILNRFMTLLGRR